MKAPDATATSPRLNATRRTPPRVSPMLQRALEYAAKGWHVFPLAPDGKVPLVRSHGVKDATTDTATIRQWFTEKPDANLAIATGQSRLVVVDADTHKPGCAFEDLIREHLELPATFCVMTASGGRHFYFVQPPGVMIKSGNDKLGHAVDIKAEGGYVVAPPSTFEGRPYRVLCAQAPANLPQWLLDLLLAALPRQIQRSNDVSVSGSVSVSVSVSVKELDRLVAECLPKGTGQTDATQWKLAKSLVAADIATVLRAFDQWYAQANALGFLKPQGRDRYLAEFLHRCAQARKPLNPVDAAWQQAATEPAPPEAGVFESQEMRQLVCLCWLLQRSHGDDWYVPCDALARLAGVTKQTASLWIKALIELRIIDLTKAAIPGIKARRFKFLGGQPL